MKENTTLLKLDHVAHSVAEGQPSRGLLGFLDVGLIEATEYELRQLMTFKSGIIDQTACMKVTGSLRDATKIFVVLWHSAEGQQYSLGILPRERTCNGAYAWILESLLHVKPSQGQDVYDAQNTSPACLRLKFR